jgi:phosphotransferase system IIA component
VEADQPVVRFDPEAIKAAGYAPVTPVVTNAEVFPVK